MVMESRDRHVPIFSRVCALLRSVFEGRVSNLRRNLRFLALTSKRFEDLNRLD